MTPRSSWGTRFGFYMAAIGSSFGLGNLWRFPYVVGSNGGGAFVILYVFFALAIGVPLLIAELMLGKLSKQSAVGSIDFALRKEERPRSSSPNDKRVSSPWSGWKKFDMLWFGRIAIFASLLLLSYYAVVSGWVLYFFSQFAISAFTNEPVQPIRAYQNLLGSGSLQMGLATIHILIASYIVTLGLREGIEKWIGYIMSVFVILVLFLVTQSLQLPGTAKALRFLFYPDFSKFRATSLIQVLGHVFFSLSIGMGAMVAFGSYLRDDIKTSIEGVRVAILDTTISLIVGLLIFPLVFSGGVDSEVGPGLLFQSVPLLFSRLGLGAGFGIAFFLCLYCAALGATIGLLEAGVSNLVDRKKVRRESASLIMGAVVLVLSLFPALASTTFRSWNYDGMNLLQIFDSVIISWVLPISALGVALVVGYRLTDKLKQNEFLEAGDSQQVRLYRNWSFVLRWLAPLLIIGALIANTLGSILELVSI